MLHILLTILLSILKITGIILAVIIGILLIVLICGLFVPVRYRVSADGKLGEEHPVRVEIKATWLLHIVNVMFSYRESACLRIRLFGFSLLDSSRKKESRKKKKEKGRRKKERDSGSNSKDRGKEETDDPETEGPKEKEPETESTEGAGAKAGMEESEHILADKSISRERGMEEDGAEKEDAGGIRAFFHAVFRFFRKLLEAVKNIEYTIQEMCGKIKKITENIRYYTDILKGEAFRSVCRNAKKQLIWICRRIKPERCRINLRAGMEDPSTTGQIMAAYGMLYPLIGGNVSLQPEFEEKVIEGDLYIQGRITGIIFLTAGIRLAVDKNVWRLIKLLKKEDV